jgi:hypothetical protein
MPNRVRILVWRVRRRPLLLLLCGLTWVVYGIALYYDPPLAAPTPHVDVPWLGPVLFIPTGLTACFGAIASRPKHEHVGFAALHLATALWALHWVIQWIDGYPRGWSAVLTWFLILAILAIMAGWPEPPGYSMKFVEAAVRERRERIARAEADAATLEERAGTDDHDEGAQ